MKRLFKISCGASMLAGGLCLAGPASADPPAAYGAALTVTIRPDHFAEDVCRVVAEQASANGLPAQFLARLIWRESSFNPGAVSPKGARGIAQFMPGTASERGLSDPHDPAPALVAAAQYLRDLKARFGSLGLAAGAYNAGPTRVENWIAEKGALPMETQRYVHWITGHEAADWREKGETLDVLPISATLPFAASCVKLAARRVTASRPKGDFRPDPVKAAAAKERPSPFPWVIKVGAANRATGRRMKGATQLGANSEGVAAGICKGLRSAGWTCSVSRNPR